MDSALKNFYLARKNTYKSIKLVQKCDWSWDRYIAFRDEGTMGSALVVGGPRRLKRVAGICAVLCRLNHVDCGLSQKSLPYHWLVIKTLFFVGRATHWRYNRRVMNDSL